MQKCIGYCNQCKSNIYQTIDGKEDCMCNHPKAVLLEVRTLLSGLKESSFTCQKCQSKFIIIAKRKVNSNKKYCGSCKAEINEENHKRYTKKRYAKKIQK